MNDFESNEDELIRLLIDSWTALRAGTLGEDQQALLDRERPQWQCEAANLIAEGLLAYVTVEMVEPDLAHDRSIDPHDTPSPQDYAARLGAHMMDFVDYRGDLVKTRRLGTH
ncbi:hypothetical protein [Thiocapsa marina]|uniref:Uncharacterized protein n=1 Tax=Thiocapsa marina 5811 TaxID=768671 RepID=F9UGT9_9GAMM|nr:hypothetical protein [Thiocapsa marina]EGV16559.1 hypothetical protein ThimaDRAFT_4142 [Thiocapsa marina 5811]